MVLTRNKPEAPDILSDSQVDLKNNNNAIDDSFGLDHYAASNLTAKNGKHRHATTPLPEIIFPATEPVHYSTTDDPKFYAMNDSYPSTTLGVLQYSRGTNDAIPSPLTSKQSPSAGIILASLSTTPVIDLLGIRQCYGIISAIGTNMPPAVAGVTGVTKGFYWNGSLGFVDAVTTGFLFPRFTGSLLEIFNGDTLTNLKDVAWTVTFYRIWTPA